jgi:glutamine amidotransferase
MIVIVDYGLGNLASVMNMVNKAGGKAKISNKSNDILDASRLILPGVGAFDYGVSQLQSLGLFVQIQNLASKGVPILGICLGMQLLANRSEEGSLKGLALIDAYFKRFSFESTTSLNIPHVGWNQTNVVKTNPLIPRDGTEQRFYFTHSYHAVCSKDTDILATTDYGYTFPSAYCRDNVFGVQFHPEKSHRFGMALIKSFLHI